METILCVLQAKNASHFAAWSGCLIAHEMWRKAQLTGTEGMGGEEGATEREGEGMEEWMKKTQDVINSLKNGLLYMYVLMYFHIHYNFTIFKKIF